MKTVIEKFAFDTSSSPPIYCEQQFFVVDGALVHYVAGDSRAVISPENVGEYLKSKNIVQALTVDEAVLIMKNFSDFAD